MYFITFTDMLGTQGEKIARQVAENLNYSFYGEAELLEAARGMGFFSDVKQLDEKGPGFFDLFFSEEPKIFLERLQSVIYEVAKNGNAIFHGRGSQLLLSSFGCALHVLIIASDKKRIQELMEKQKIERDVAEKMIHRSDSNKKGFLRFAFHEDWQNPHLYDFILNMDKLNVDAAVRMVMDAAKSEEIKTCGIDSVATLGKLSLHRRIESALLEAGVITHYLFIDVEDLDAARVYGMVTSPDDKQKVEAILKGLKDVKRVKSDLTLFRQYS